MYAFITLNKGMSYLFYPFLASNYIFFSALQLFAERICFLFLKFGVTALFRIADRKAQ